MKGASREVHIGQDFIYLPVRKEWPSRPAANRSILPRSHRGCQIFSFGQLTSSSFSRLWCCRRTRAFPMCWSTAPLRRLLSSF